MQIWNLRVCVSSKFPGEATAGTQIRCQSSKASMQKRQIQTPQGKVGQAASWNPGRRKCPWKLWEPLTAPADISMEAQSALEETHLRATGSPPRLVAPRATGGILSLRQFTG